MYVLGIIFPFFIFNSLKINNDNRTVSLSRSCFSKPVCDLTVSLITKLIKVLDRECGVLKNLFLQFIPYL